MSLVNRFPGRENQIKFLQRFIRKSNVCGPDLFIFGTTGTGKTSVVRELLKESQVSHVFINCVECYQPSILFDLVLNGIAGHQPLPTNGYSNYLSTRGNITTFLEALKNVIQENSETHFLVFDKTERMTHSDFGASLVSALLRLDELTNRNISVIFLSSIPYHSFASIYTDGIRDPLTVHFPNYNKEEMTKLLIYLQRNILKEEKNPSKATIFTLSNPIYLESLVNQIIQVFYLFINELNEMLQLVQLLLPEYLTPLLNSEIPKFNTIEETIGKLNMILQPKLVTVVKSIGMNHISFLDIVNSMEHSQTVKKEEKVLWKYILLAAYIASHNHEKTDVSIFGRTKESRTKKPKKEYTQGRAGGVKEKITNEFVTPKYFSLFRLEAILDSIIDKDTVHYSNSGLAFESASDQNFILMEIGNLVQLNLLETKGKNRVEAQYRCSVDKLYVNSIASSIGFQLNSFLSQQ